MSGLKLLFSILRIGILAFALNYASSPSEVWVMKLLIILVALIWGITEAIEGWELRDGSK